MSSPSTTSLHPPSVVTTSDSASNSSANVKTNTPGSTRSANQEFRQAGKEVISQNQVRRNSPSKKSAAANGGDNENGIDNTEGDKYNDVSIRSDQESPRGLKSDISSRFFASDHYTPVLIIRQSLLRTSEHTSDTSSYVNLLQYGMFLVFYCIVLFRQIDNSGSREVKATLLDNLFSGGGEVPDWNMVLSHDSPSSISTFSYDGSLVDPLTNGDPMDFFSPGELYLQWFKHDILNEVYSDDNKGTQFLEGYEVVGGVMLSQTRAAEGTCVKTSFFSLDRCLISETLTPSYEPFGRDYTYEPNSPIYNSTGVGGGEVPMGFWKDQRNVVVQEEESLVGFGTRPAVSLNNYPIIFPRTISRERVDKISLLLDGNYVDEYTTSLTTSMVLFNRKNDIFSFVKVQGKKVSNSIRWKLTTNVYTIDPVVYSDDGRDISRTIMEALYLISLFFLIVRELFELREEIRHNGNIAGFLIYATNFGNIIDCGNYAVQVISNVAWLNFALMAGGWDPKLEYDVMEDQSGGHEYFKAGPELFDCVQVLQDVTEFSKARTLHKTMASVSLVLCCIQMVKNLDFHPRMGLITRTISHAAGPMFFFFILFFTVVLVYAFMGTIQYGSSMEEFRSVGVSIEYLFFMLLGEFFDTREGMNDAESSVSILFFWTFMMICYFILINAFLAIIVEAYEQTKSGFDAISYTDAMWSVIHKINLWRQPTGGEFHLNARDMQEALQWSLGIYDEEMKEGDIPKLVQEKEKWKKYELKDIPNALRAVVIRKRDGDNVEDGTVTETGERIFFSQSHLFRALTNAHPNPKKHTPNAIPSDTLAMVIAYNILIRFGMKADVNDDGEITNAEILSLKADARHGGNALNFATVALASKAKEFAQQADALTTTIGANVVDGRRLSNFGGNLLDGGLDIGGAAVRGVRGSLMGGVGVLGKQLDGAAALFKKNEESEEEEGEGRRRRQTDLGGDEPHNKKTRYQEIAGNNGGEDYHSADEQDHDSDEEDMDRMAEEVISRNIDGEMQVIPGSIPSPGGGAGDIELGIRKSGGEAAQ